MIWVWRISNSSSSSRDRSSGEVSEASFCEAPLCDEDGKAELRGRLLYSAMSMKINLRLAFSLKRTEGGDVEPPLSDSSSLWLSGSKSRNLLRDGILAVIQSQSCRRNVRIALSICLSMDEEWSPSRRRAFSRRSMLNKRGNYKRTRGPQ